MLNSLRKTAQVAVSKRQSHIIKADDFDLNIRIEEPLLLSYQRNWLNVIEDNGDYKENKIKLNVTVFEKSRQIGWSFVAAAYKSVIDCLENKRDIVYTSYNRDSAEQYIKDCRKYAELANLAFQYVAHSQAINSQNINVFKLTFNNGRTINAIAGNSENLRAKPGNGIIIDEAAYRQDSLENLIAAAMATVIHGGWIMIASTHAGKDNDFNKLIQGIKQGKIPYTLVTTTFRQAVADGLFKRECWKRGQRWTQELEDAWVEEIYKFYGIRASEELDVIPGDFTGGDKVFTPSIFKIIDLDLTKQLVFFRYYDIASSTDANAYFSASVLIAWDATIDELCIVDYTAEQLTPMAGDDNMIAIAQRDPYHTIHIIEVEPGASGIKYVEYMKTAMSGYTVVGYAPKISKIQRALPCSTAAQQGKLKISKELIDLNGECKFLEIIRKFDGSKKPLVNDLVDCISGVYDYYRIYHKGVEDSVRNFYSD